MHAAWHSTDAELTQTSCPGLAVTPAGDISTITTKHHFFTSYGPDYVARRTHIYPAPAFGTAGNPSRSTAHKLARGGSLLGLLGAASPELKIEKCTSTYVPGSPEQPRAPINLKRCPEADSHEIRGIGGAWTHVGPARHPRQGPSCIGGVAIWYRGLELDSLTNCGYRWVPCLQVLLVEPDS